MSNENEIFLLDNETRSSCTGCAVTCPPLTNKEGKKRGAGNDTSFGDSTGVLPEAAPAGTSRCSLYENERGLSTRTRSRCSLLLRQLLKDGLLDRWPLYRKRERGKRDEGTRISETGHRSVQFKRPLREGLIQDNYLTTCLNIFIDPYNLPLI